MRVSVCPRPVRPRQPPESHARTDALIEGHCDCFADYDGPESEQRLEWGELHTRYVELVEGAIADELGHLECSDQELFEYARSVGGGADGSADRLMSKLLAHSDYHAFCELMRSAHGAGHVPASLVDREMD